MRPTPQNPAIAAQIQQAVVLHQRGDHDKAEAMYKKVLAKAPRHFQALYLMGMLQLHREDPAGAIEWIDQALKINPTHIDAQFDRATALEDLERYTEALRSYDLVLALKSDFTEALYRRGNVLRAMKRHMEALDCYKRVLAVKPDHAQAWLKQGNSLNDLGRLREALTCYEKAVEAAPEYPEALFNLANTLKEFDRIDEAMATYDKVLEIEPDFAEAIANRAYLLAGKNRLEEALAGYDRAIALLPDYPDMAYNRAVTLEELQRYDEAIAAYAQVPSSDPNYQSARWNTALCNLKLGNLEAGWRQYEQRWQTEQMRKTQRYFTQPLWLGEVPLAGKTILLHSEQGFGDTLQFARYVPMLAERGARVILQVQPALKPLMATIKGVGAVLATGEQLPPFDLHCPLMSLPLACQTFSLNDIPGAGYLQPDPAKSESWKVRLGEKRKPRVGIVWSGSNPRVNSPATKRLDAARSIPFNALSPLLQNDQIEFFAVQPQNSTLTSLSFNLGGQSSGLNLGGPRLVDYTRDLRDFSDTAALIANLDLVISVDTAAAHLAGSLGKPVWLLNRCNTDWRWLLGRNDSPWYPSMRIFRQEKPGDWSKVIEDVRAELQRQTQG
ncbi:tetratricopeptide repeat protein [Herbaspirillum rhizosphaerae]|uniref:tetratricopeptide repeat-containing glycosyltransferase family protein n=1 Tax=Herbaspirillum rhizosphaerae TaxID=346179 RepID=UPI00067C4272|nr:tetratricopeptide repeat-containing glycosyltransferase family protein [Herbaspirillum rhizosphaerae]